MTTVLGIAAAVGAGPSPRTGVAAVAISHAPLGLVHAIAFTGPAGHLFYLYLFTCLYTLPCGRCVIRGAEVI